MFDNTIKLFNHIQRLRQKPLSVQGDYGEAVTVNVLMEKTPRTFLCIWRISVADLGSGIRCLFDSLDPGYGMGKKSGPGSDPG